MATILNVEGDLASQPSGYIDLTTPDEFSQLDATEAAASEEHSDLFSDR